MDTFKLLEEYFHQGYPNQAIVDLLEKLHGVRMHVRTLKRRLKALGLRRKEGDCDEDLLRNLIKQEMQGTDSLDGYRYVWHSLRLKYHVNVPRSVICCPTATGPVVINCTSVSLQGIFIWTYCVSTLVTKLCC